MGSFALGTRRKLLPLLLLIVTFLMIPTYIYAQLEIAETYDMPEGAQDGDIVSYTDQRVVLSGHDYDDKIFGVIETNPLVAYRRQDNTGLPVVRSGTAEVSVITSNGPIRTGDFITSSAMPGKGQKATASGYIIGVALGDFSEQDGEVVDYQDGVTVRQVRQGKINVAIKIEFAEIDTARNQNRLFDSLNNLLFRNIQDPEKFVSIIRYVLAGLAILLSFLIGFFTLARTIPKGIEALGRNPLARATIQFGIVLNIIFTVGIALVGIVAAIIILRF